jgi:hypothetical protein
MLGKEYRMLLPVRALSRLPRCSGLTNNAVAVKIGTYMLDKA